MSDFQLISDDEGARDLQRLRAGLGVRSGSSLDSPDQLSDRGRIIVELIEDLPADDFGQYSAKQVDLVGGEFEPIRVVQVRKIINAAISAGEEEDPTRLVARRIANLGWCVGEVESETSSTSSGGVTGSCCGCGEPDNFPSYDWGEGREPTKLHVVGISLSCCSPEAYTLTRGIEDSSWSSGEVDCGDEEENSIQWELSGESLIGTHSTLGVVASYQLNEYDTDPFCSRRFHLRSEVTPSQNQNCAVCGEVACISPGVLGADLGDCFSTSRHFGSLPSVWWWEEEEIDTGQPGLFDGSGLLEWKTRAPTSAACEWNHASCSFGNYTLNYCPNTALWKMWKGSTVGFGCDSPGNIDNRPPCGSIYLPDFELPDADLNPQGVNEVVVQYGGGGTYLFRFGAIS